MSLLARWVDEPSSKAFKLHLATIPDFFWIAEDGLKIGFSSGSRVAIGEKASSQSKSKMDKQVLGVAKHQRETRGRCAGLKGTHLVCSLIIFQLMQQSVGSGRCLAAQAGWRTSIFPEKEVLLNGDRPDQAMNLDECSRLRTFGNSKIYLEESKALKEKLGKCVIGEALDPINVESLLQEVKSDCNCLEEVRMPGAMKVMMVFDSTQNMDKMMESNTLAKHFLEIRKWTSGEANRTKECWIEVSRLPLHGWTRENMLKIGNVWGKAMDIEEMAEGHYSYFRVLVVTNIGPRIWAMANIVIKEETFSIFIRELEVRRTTADKKENSKETKERIDCETPIMVAESGRHGNGNDGGETGGREAEGSRVGETQPTSEERGDGNETLEQNKGPMGEDTINVGNPSPTKTKTLEDDRRTKDVIQEWEDECYVKPTNEYEAQSEGLITSNPMETTHSPMELESSSTSIPPGFGNVDTTETASEGLDIEKGRAGKHGRQNGSRRHMKIVLNLNDRLKENARKQKEA
ncbi:hypothetical protein PIB30_038993 [Stylosanthes scabra]|uniref:DUF4283 domain-containing protein n=1 Tax=Stylosanthes scabra TaxID=79078 RepID=A0ABU6YEK9_9FABA|nr:hypothetical protein [Stylosanthes scabra]